MYMSSKPSKLISLRPRDRAIEPVVIKNQERKSSERGTSSPLVVLYSFIALISVGTLFLMLPFSSVTGDINLVDAIFTATSAATVTGLTVLDTPTIWSIWGQIIIAILIVIGGIGFMTGAAFFLLAAGQTLGLQGRRLIGQNLGEEKMGSIGQIVVRVVLSALLFQLIGFIIFFLLFSIKVGLEEISQNIWYSIFHSISSFNNAGFTIFQMGNNLEPFARGYLNNIILIVTAIMFFFGGLGYFVISDLLSHRRVLGKRRIKIVLSLETKLILIGSFVLSLFGLMMIMIFEYSNPATIGNMSLSEKIINSLFTSMSTRTAGFNSFDFSATYDYTKLLCALLIFIGGAPASTAGGIKITTFLISMFMISNHILGRENITAFGREIPYETGVRAIVIMVLSVLIIGLLIVTVSFIEREYQFVNLTFEIFSAYGTNGMTAGVSPDIKLTSKIIFIITMVIGRLGPMTLALLLAGSQKKFEYRFFQEKVRIG